jgi:hypothetical protein
MKQMMKQFIGIMLFTAFLSGFTSCHNVTIKKPDNLIKRDKFVKMMVDIYLIQGMNDGGNKLKVLKRVKPTDLYYSVLKKYSVADTVFVRSLIYYSSFPKEYEKMHTEIMTILNESEQQFKPKEKLTTETQ